MLITKRMPNQIGSNPAAKISGKVIGSTRFFRVDENNARLELGHTWYARRFQRSAVNSECKLLLLGHAFETLNAVAVELRTHWHNHASRTAIARLGAKQDGVLRHHTRSADGIYRDTVVFSILEQEWRDETTVLKERKERLEKNKSTSSNPLFETES